MKFKALAVIPHPGEIEIKPLVLCKNCMYRTKEKKEIRVDGQTLKWCVENSFYVADDWFCADGIRKGEKGEDDAAD